MKLSNGDVEVTVGPSGLTTMEELSLQAGTTKLSLTLGGDGWAAHVSAGTSGPLRRFLVSAKPPPPPPATLLNSSSCSPLPAKATQPDPHSAVLAWECRGGSSGQERYLYTVDVVYSLQPAGAFVTKTLRIGAGGGAGDDPPFTVHSVTPWTGLSVAAAGATQPASWLGYTNGFSTKLEIAGFARFSEL
jgi:hypothetical protein